MKQNKPFISVIIPTFNRAESLRNTLNSLLSQECDGSFDCEIIVVDNNSKDKTKDIVSGFKNRFNGRLIYEFENQQGRSYALNRGIKVAKGEIIAFTDDDCIADKNWIKSINEIFVSKDLDLLGARVEPLFKTKIPEWLNIETMKGPIVYYNLGNRHIENNERRIPICGANMCFRKESFNKYGGFYFSGRGQDGELSNKWRRLGAKIAYNPNPIIYHATDPERLTKHYFRKWYFLSGKHCTMFKKFDDLQGRQFLGAPLWAYRKLVSSAIDFLKAAILLKKDVFEKEIWFWHYLGITFGNLGFKRSLENLR